MNMPDFLRPMMFLPLAVALMGTSRPLRHKVLTGTVTQAPATLTVTMPTGRFGENVNNQGCGAQRVDLTSEITVQNTGTEPVEFGEGASRIVVDGETMEPAQRRYTVGGEERITPYRTVTIAPGATERVEIGSYGFDDVGKLDSVRTIEVQFASTAGPVMVRYEHVDQVATVSE